MGQKLPAYLRGLLAPVLRARGPSEEQLPPRGIVGKEWGSGVVLMGVGPGLCRALHVNSGAKILPAG
jgi:hypothetical protein